ncbi:MAG TPA: DUF4186 domain-containing protein [Mycobacteriales bacterium]|jgi:hypothetical protein|nr:DUF4186 domain-containing protein [Mycobacteriales bacterium]
MPDEIDQRLARLATQPFRARFSLRGPDRVTAEVRTPSTMRLHARDIIRQRLAPAHPRKDGKQTPYRGHPVFIAQHATATCCRTCLAKWHGIAPGVELTPEQQDYVVDVITRWIEHQLAVN